MHFEYVLNICGSYGRAHNIFKGENVGPRGKFFLTENGLN